MPNGKWVYLYRPMWSFAVTNSLDSSTNCNGGIYACVRSIIENFAPPANDANKSSGLGNTGLLGDSG